MIDQDCHEMEMAAALESEYNHDDFTASSCDHDVAASTCELCECNFKETPLETKVTLDQVQVTKLAPIILPFLYTIPDSLPSKQDKPRKTTSLFKDSSPVYLMNLVLLI